MLVAAGSGREHAEPPLQPDFFAVRAIRGKFVREPPPGKRGVALCRKCLIC